MSKNLKYILSGVIAVAVIVGGWFLMAENQKPGKLDGFAKCLSDSGAKLYGTFWCPHCQDQKALFGKSVKLVPYVECSTPDGKGQLAVCSDQDITSYPTWKFADGSRNIGVMSLQDLSNKTGCNLPE